jgi:hypothetical protein
MSMAFTAKQFYLTEPSRGLFIVNFRIGSELQRMEITRDQLRNFLVDGTAMALRNEDKKQDLVQSNTESAEALHVHPVSEVAASGEQMVIPGCSDSDSDRLNHLVFSAGAGTSR